MTVPVSSRVVMKHAGRPAGQNQMSTWQPCCKQVAHENLRAAPQLPRSNSLFQTRIFSLVYPSKLKCGGSFFFHFSFFFPSVLPRLRRCPLAVVQSQPASAACIIKPPVGKTTFKFMGSAALHMEPVSALVSALLADLHRRGRSLSARPAAASARLAAAPAGGPVSQQAAGTRGPDLSASRLNVFSITAKQKFDPRLVVCC